MKKSLVLVFCLLTIFLAFLITKPNFLNKTDELITLKKVSPVESDSTDKIKELDQLNAPKPILIEKRIDLEKIKDLKLKAFVVRNASFFKNKILYFEWKGHKEDKIKSYVSDTTEIDPYGNESTITKTHLVYNKKLNYGEESKDWEKNQMIHRQVFIIPKNHEYEINVDGN